MLKSEEKHCHHHHRNQDENKSEMEYLCISIVPLFNHLNQSELLEIVKTAQSQVVKRGEMIYRSGEQSKGLYIVHKGQIKIFRLSQTGKEQIVRILGPGDFSGELSLFSESEHDAYAEALEPVELCVMERSTFQQLLLKYPNISIKMLTEFSTRLSKTEKRAAVISMETVETRLAMYLANQVEEQKSNQVNLLMSRKDLASHLGTTPETISRKLTEFEAANLIQQISQREIHILDLDALLLLE